MRGYAVDVEQAAASHLAPNGVGWPIPLLERTRLVEASVDTFDGWIAGIVAPEDRRVLSLAALGILTALLKVVVFAAEARASGDDKKSSAAEHVWGHPVAFKTRSDATLRRHALSMASTLRWTVSLFGFQDGATALVRGERWLLRPTAMSLEAAASEKRGFVVADLRSFADPVAVIGKGDDPSDLALRLKETVLDTLVPEGRYSSALREAFLAGLMNELNRARCMLAFLRENRRLPSVLWAGSAGHYVSRALALEVLRRGGIVRRFTHGGGFGLDGYGRCRMMVEACGASEIVVPTEALAGSIDRSRYANGSAFAGPPIVGWRGDPQFRSFPISRSTGWAPKTLLYMGSMYTGTHIHVPPPPPGQLYFDWQLRLTTALERMGYDVLCRPHPENVVLHGQQPLARFRPISREPFKDVLASAAVVVFDYCFSTAFWEALCSDVPVVLLDLTGAKFQPEIGEALRRRVSIVHVAHNARNRPVIDPDVISDAISMAMRRTDPGEFRALLAGAPQ